MRLIPVTLNIKIVIYKTLTTKQGRLWKFAIFRLFYMLRALGLLSLLLGSSAYIDIDVPIEREPWHELLELAIKSDDPDRIDAVMLDRNVKIDQQFLPGKRTPLFTAVMFNNTRAVGALIKAGADLNMPERVSKYAPIDAAAFLGHAVIAKMLIEKGADYQYRHEDGYVPLHRACWGRTKDHALTAKEFLLAGVDVHVVATNEKIVNFTHEGLECQQMTENQQMFHVLWEFVGGQPDEDGAELAEDKWERFDPSVREQLLQEKRARRQRAKAKAKAKRHQQSQNEDDLQAEASVEAREPQDDDAEDEGTVVMN